MANETVRYTDTQKIKNLLVGRKVVDAKNTTLTLDNGVKLTIVPNEGCWGCTSGCYQLTELNDCPNLITNVKFADKKSENGDDTLEVFVYAEHQKINLYTVKGGEGNGYYGSGYNITVRLP